MGYIGYTLIFLSRKAHIAEREESVKLSKTVDYLRNKYGNLEIWVENR